MSLIEEIKKLDMSCMNKWEWFKFKVKRLAIDTGKFLSRMRKQKQKDLIGEINLLAVNSQISPENTAKLQELQPQLDELYSEKANGAYIRSRARWIEKGEKSSSYFFGLEKQRQTKKKINKLEINEIIIEDHKEIQNEIWLFYRNLYSSKFKKADCDSLFNNITDNIQKLNEDDKNLIDDELTIAELDVALKRMKNGKSPGIDGLTTEFVKHFWKDIRKLLYNALLECIQKGSLSPTMKTGLITLLPKPKKQLLSLDNWRPITLFTDYRLFALVYPNRLKLVLEKLVEEFQSAFIKGRYIQNHIRLILDMIDYNSMIQSDSLILFIDFFKAFDTVEHDFIFTTLKV